MTKASDSIGELAFEHGVGIAPQPVLWRVVSLRNVGERRPIVHVNWYTEEESARHHAKWIDDVRGNVLRIDRYVLNNPEAR
jgi:hypothetical protein